MKSFRINRELRCASGILRDVNKLREPSVFLKNTIQSSFQVGLKRYQVNVSALCPDPAAGYENLTIPEIVEISL